MDNTAMTSAPGNSSNGRGDGRGRGTRPGSRGAINGGRAAIASDRGEETSQMDFGGRPRGRARGRGGGRGRGNRDRTNNHSQPMAPHSERDPTSLQPPPQPGGAGVFGGRLSKDAETSPQGENEGASAAANEAVEAEVCFICASPVAHNSVAPCNHRTCHICALRLRALYKTKACAHCRTEATTVIFTDDAEKRYEDYSQSDFFQTDGNLGIAYEKPEIFEDTVLLLRYNCPDPSCDVACLGWPDLHRHVKSVHQKQMCDLCTRNKKVFTHEHELFTQNELRKHEKFGDDNPGAIDQSGFKGHPECGFCRKRFYGDDELYAHCREKHERCHLCDRRTGGQTPQYYMNYEALERHFNKDHFPCLDSECQEKKFVVFDSEMDLKAHQLESHPNGLSKDARRDARRVDMSSFDYRPVYQEPRRGGRRGGRGRDPNSEPMPASSGGHMSRAEIAHQREREIQSAQTVTSRTFGGQLTQQSEPQVQSVQRPPQSPRPTNTQPANDLTSLNNLIAVNTSTIDTRPIETLTPQEQARRLRHTAVTERAAHLLRNDQNKLNEFRERISTYRNDNINATELIDAFFALFDASSAEVGKLIKELAEIFEISAKRDSLLRAWNDWKAINEDYPSLPGPAGENSTSAAGVLRAGIGSSRVLKLKSSTAQSSRSAIGTQRSWGSANSAPSKTPFPSLPPSNSVPKGSAPPAPTPAWLSLRPAAASSSANSSTRASPAPSRTQSSANLSKTNAFPALPAAKKPTSTVFSPGYTGAGVIRSSAATTGGAWGAGNTPSPPVRESEPEIVGKGKGKKGKQVLFQWG